MPLLHIVGLTNNTWHSYLTEKCPKFCRSSNMKHKVNLQKLDTNIPNQQNRNVLARKKPHHNHSTDIRCWNRATVKNFVVSLSTQATNLLYFYAHCVRILRTGHICLFNCMFQADNHWIDFDEIHYVIALGSQNHTSNLLQLANSRCYGVGLNEMWQPWW